ncbi:hypothetical protein [Ruegeria atlantica]|uniref:hypothetical protein n=1 Tax=Ruegeria atlantica TaxID=81569 RepID=UPI00147F671C|nr:hypothetical protein [Ruegeria atlantica]
MNIENPTFGDIEAARAVLAKAYEGQPIGQSLAWLGAKTHDQRLLALRPMLEDCYRSLTDNRQVNQGHSEDALSQEIVDMLYRQQVDAAHDRRNGGHCDITVKARDGFFWIGEAKIHGGYQWLFDGFDQLSTRYAVAQFGRDNGEIIIYHRGQNSRLVLENWRDKLLEERSNVELVNDGIESGRLFFETKHNCVASGFDFFTRHTIVPMYHAPAK